MSKAFNVLSTSYKISSTITKFWLISLIVDPTTITWDCNVRSKRFNFALLASKAGRISPGIYTYNYMNRYKKK